MENSDAHRSSSVGGDSLKKMKSKANKEPKRLPPWMWSFISKSLGIQQKSKDKSILAIVFYILTFGSATGLMVFQLWYSGFNIASNATKADILDGLEVIIVCGVCCALGIYAHKLAYKLFKHPKFLDMMRLHSKTVAKLNNAVLIFVMMALFIVAANLHTCNFMYFHVEPERKHNKHSKHGNFTDTKKRNIIDNRDSAINPCQTIEIPLWICQAYYINQVIFSFFFLIWNGVVAIVLVSVARTHTMAIRRFIFEMDCDAYLMDKKMRNETRGKIGHDKEEQESLYHYLWADSDAVRRVVTGMAATEDGDEIMAEEQLQRNVNEEIEEEPTFFPNGSGQVHLELSDETGNSTRSGSVVSSTRSFGFLDKVRIFNRFRKLSEDLSDDNDDSLTSFRPHIMSNDEIMHKYWRLVTSTNLTSQAFQRWISCVIVVVLFFTTKQLVFWLSNNPTITGVTAFVCPLLTLPLIASSYAEVNYEGIDALQSIFPTNERAAMFRYLYGMPIQLSAYNHPISYRTMSTVLVAILAAFASKILLREINIIMDL